MSTDHVVVPHRSPSTVASVGKKVAVPLALLAVPVAIQVLRKRRANATGNATGSSFGLIDRVKTSSAWPVPRPRVVGDQNLLTPDPHHAVKTMAWETYRNHMLMAAAREIPTFKGVRTKEHAQRAALASAARLFSAHRVEWKRRKEVLDSLPPH